MLLYGKIMRVFTLPFVVILASFALCVCSKSLTKNREHVDDPSPIHHTGDVKDTFHGNAANKANHGHTRSKVGRKDKIEASTGVVLNSEPIRPALSTADRAGLMRIRSYLKAIHNQLDAIRLAKRTHTTINGREAPTDSVKDHGKTVKPTDCVTDIDVGIIQTAPHRGSTTPVKQGPDGGYQGFSPTKSSPIRKETTHTTPHTPTKATNNASQHVHERNVPGRDLFRSFKQQVSESFLKSLGDLKTSLTQMDKDIEDGIRQLYNLDTDHYNMASGYIRSNGDKLDRLQKYLTSELDLIKRGVVNLTSATLRLSQTVQGAMDKLVNVTDTTLKLTYIINDRTSRSRELEEKLMKMTIEKFHNCKFHKGICVRKDNKKRRHKHRHGIDKQPSIHKGAHQKYSSLQDYLTTKKKHYNKHHRVHHKTKSVDTRSPLRDVLKSVGLDETMKSKQKKRSADEPGSPLDNVVKTAHKDIVKRKVTGDENTSESNAEFDVGSELGELLKDAGDSL